MNFIIEIQFDQMMESLPSSIVNYFNRPYDYVYQDRNDTLTYLCISAIVFKTKIYILPIEEFIGACYDHDYTNTNAVILSYALTDKLTRQLKIRHLEVIFDIMLKIIFVKLKDYINNNIFHLYNVTNELVKCKICSKLLLPSRVHAT